MRKWTIFAAGAAYGLAMRLAFGGAWLSAKHAGNTAAGPMLVAFVVGVPFLLGAWTAVAARERSPGVVFALFGPWLPTSCFVAGTALLLIEGSLCIVMALPIFLFATSAGGLVGWVIGKTIRPRPAVMNSLLLLPLLGGAVETRVPLSDDLERSTESVHIAAPPEAIWRLINHATDIQPAEMAQGLAWRIGVPSPEEAITRDTPAGGRVRQLKWAGDVRFDEPITGWQENRFIRWNYSFTPASFPPGTLDEHVLIGGRYFDLTDTSYTLTPEAGGTRLDIVVDYRVSTNFNWYAVVMGRLLVDDAAGTILAFYKHRAEHRA